mgnify:FL=1
MEPSTVYTTNAEWLDESDRTIFVACSDPRFYPAHREFVHEHLRLERPASIIVPGGAAQFLWSASYFFAMQPMGVLLDQKYHIERVVAIAHKKCAYYAHKYPHLTDELVVHKQHSDLHTFKALASKLCPRASVECFYETPAEKHVQFFRIE